MGEYAKFQLEINKYKGVNCPSNPCSQSLSSILPASNMQTKKTNERLPRKETQTDDS